jgi:hypothetical protein
MWFHSLLASWKSARPRRTPPARRGAHLILERLEDRTLLSSYTAYTASDLIADINAANAAGGANTITLAAPTTSPYALTARTTGVNGGNGLPVIAANDNLTIVGNGDTIEKAANPGLAFRLLDVAPLATLTLQNLTLQGGLASEAGLVTTGPGGAIYNEGVLTLSGVTVANNHAVGGGRYPYTVATPGSGGGIWSNGSLTLENGTLFEGNVASGSGAAIGDSGGPDGFYTPGVPAGAASGGAVYVAGGTANISNTTFTGNSAVGGLGTLDGLGLPGGNAYGGALYVAAGQVILTAATVNNNLAYTPLAYTANGPPTAYGGGLYVAGGRVTLASDTVDSNTVRYNVNNLAEPSDPESHLGGYGGGLYIVSGATVVLDSFTVANTINNSDSTGINGSTANIDGIYIEPPAAGQPPIVAQAASASPSPVTGATTNLNVLGADAAGASSLTYTWAVTSAPAGAATPTFSSNGSNASQNTTATFHRAGTYTFQVTITDPSGLTAVSSVTVTVVQTPTSLSLTPATVTLADGAKQQFTATAFDQFGQALAAQPTFTWQVIGSGGGTISSAGLYTAPKKGTGKFQVEVSADGLTALVDVTVDA